MGMVVLKSEDHNLQSKLDRCDHLHKFKPRNLKHKACIFHCKSEELGIMKESHLSFSFSHNDLKVCTKYNAHPYLKTSSEE